MNRLSLTVVIFLFYIHSSKTNPIPLLKVNDENKCPSDWVQYENKKCFKLFFTPKTHGDAEDDCKTRGAHLASINSEDELRFISDYALNEGDPETIGDLWVGGRRRGKTNFRWLWTDLSRFTYVNWYPGYPKDFEGNTNIGLGITTWKPHFEAMKNYGKFFNDAVTTKRNYVCQKRLNESPIYVLYEVKRE